MLKKIIISVILLLTFQLSFADFKEEYDEGEYSFSLEQSSEIATMAKELSKEEKEEIFQKLSSKQFILSAVEDFNIDNSEVILDGTYTLNVKQGVQHIVLIKSPEQSSIRGIVIIFITQDFLFYNVTAITKNGKNFKSILSDPVIQKALKKQGITLTQKQINDLGI